MSSSDPRIDFYSQRYEGMAQRYPEFDRSAMELCLELALTRDRVERRLNQILEPSGISLTAFNVLAILEQQENFCAPLHEIGRLLVTSRANVTGLVDGLVGRGLVERTPHPVDRRIKFAKLLPAGVELVRSQFETFLRAHQHFCQDISAADRQVMIAGLRRMGERA